MQKSIFLKSQIILLFVLSIIVINFSSCKGDKKGKSLDDVFSEESFSLDFSINGVTKPGFDRIGQDYLESEYYDDPMNEDHVMHVTIGDSITFKDKSKISAELAKNRRWFIDAQELPSQAEEISWYSDIPATFRVTLKYSDEYVVQKGVYLVENLESFEDFLSSEPEETVDNSQAANTSSPTNNTKTSTSSNSSRNTSNNSSSSVTKATAPAPPAIKNVDFSMDKVSVEAGTSIVFRDQSTPAAAINVRVWDFGDGNNMTTKGSTVKHAFRQEGSYKINLCLNYSSNCKSKLISVIPASKPVVVVPKPKPPTSNSTSSNASNSSSSSSPPPPPPKATVSKVYFSMPTSGSVGAPISIEDTSIPNSAVTKRDWYVNGSNLKLNRSKLSKIFDKAGRYEVKLCVNDSQKDCYSTVINIEEDTKPTVAASSSSSSAPPAGGEFLCMSTIKGGIRTAQKCPKTSGKMVDSNNSFTIKPSTQIELRNATVYGNKVGTVDIKLTSTDGKVSRTLKKVQILPGRTIIEFGEFATTLQSGTTYKVEMIMNQDDGIQLEDASDCNSNFKQAEEAAITYNDNKMVFMDIKFCY